MDIGKRHKSSETLRYLFVNEEQRVERYTNYIRILLCFVYASVALNFRQEMTPAHFNTIIIASFIYLVYTTAVYFELRKQTPASWTRNTSITLDIILLSLVLFSFGAHRTFKTDMFLVYFLWIGLSTLRYSARQTLIAGLMSIGLYFIIACLAITSGSVELGSLSDSFTSAKVSQTGIALQLSSLAAFVLLAGWISFVFRGITAKAIRDDLLEEKNVKLNEALHKLRSTQKQLAARNRELATLYEIDALSQLFNRRKIDMILQDALIESANSSEPLTLIQLDIDHFKQINEEYGHQTGDRIIRAVADQLRLTARGNDNIGRWGGAEYLIVCPDTEQEAAQILSERLRKRIESCNFELKDRVTCSFGVTVHRKGETVAALLKRVDDALNRAKELGRNQVCLL